MTGAPRWVAVPVLALCAMLGAAVPAAAEAPSPSGSATSPAPTASGAATAPDPKAPTGPDEPEAAATATEPELTVERAPYPGTPDKEAALVAGEDARLAEIRTVASLSRWTDKPLQTPYRLTTGASYSLVLTQRRAAYTLTDLMVLAPQTFVRQPDGAYLLSEHLIVQSGATLRLSAPTALTIRMASDVNGFVSIVNYGGRLEISGTAERPVTVTSWDRDAGQADTTTTDGRAYIRSLGGQVALSHADLDSLGFWSGRTGGLSLTGTDRPTPGALNSLGKSLTVRMEKDRAKARKADPAVKLPDSTGGVTLDKVLPPGDLPLPVLDIEQPEYSYVSAALSDVTVGHGAFGLFVAGASGVDIRRSRFSANLIDGLVLHRFVSNAVLQSVVSERNGGDGIVLARASTGTVLSEVQSLGNTRNGITISGLPLASGPSATGTPVGDYGNNSVSNSVSSDNGRYGIEVIGGHSIALNANQVTGNDMGIVVRQGAREVTAVGNTVSGQERQGIALRDGVERAVVTGNMVDGGETSIYVRDAVAVVDRNTLTRATLHSVTLVGDVSGTHVDRNTISGRGPSALDSTRAVEFSWRPFENDTSGWSDTTPLLVTLKRLAQPLTLLWITLAVIVVVTAFRGRSARRVRRAAYVDRTPLHRPDDILVATPPRAESAT